MPSVLIINETNVYKISGPVSMGMFAPTKEYLEKIPYAPIFILFGDIHNDKENFCDSKDDDTGKFIIHDPTFLKLLSDAVKGNKEENEEDGKVDFYVEGGALHLRKADVSFKDGFPMHELWNLFKQCYINPKMKEKEILEEHKPTCNLIPNIRWQSADVRFFPKEYGKVHLYDFVKNLIQTLSKEGTEQKFDNFKSILIKEIQSDGPHKEYLKNASFTVEETYEEYVNNAESLIYKQLSKIDGTFKDKIKQQIKQRFKTYITNYYATCKITDINKFKSIHNDIVNIFKITDPYSEEGKLLIDRLCLHCTNKEENLIKYSDFLMCKRAIMLDLYTLARIYKIMTNPINVIDKSVIHPFIVICYFGKIHITSIANELYNTTFNLDNTNEILMNDSLMQIVNNGTKRCIDIQNYQIGKYQKNYVTVNIKEKISTLKEARKQHEKNLKP